MTRRDARLLAVVFAAAAAALLSPLFLGRVHYLGDVMRSFQPWLTYGAQELQAGRLPLWNPYAVCGEPFLANPQNMIFFPPAQLFWLFPFAGAWRLFFLLCQALWTGALFLLYRRSGRAGAAFGALAVAWSGFTLVLWEFPGALATLPFVAVLLLLAARGAWRGMPCAAALLFLAGYTQFAYYAVITGACLAAAAAVRRKEARFPVRLAAAAALGLALAAPQILSSWETVRHSVRTALGTAEARAHLLTPLFLINFLIPDLWGKAVSSYHPSVFDAHLFPLSWSWLTTFYIGVAAPGLAAAGLAVGLRRRDVRAWAAAGLVALAVSMGVEPFFSALRLGVPGMRYMTHFSNAMMIALVALGGLAAAGAADPGRRSRGTALAVLAAGAAAATLLAAWPPARAWTAERLLGLASLSSDQDRWVARAALSAAALCAAAAPLAWAGRGRVALLILFTLPDLWRFGHDLHPLAAEDFFQRPVPLAGLLQGSDARFCIDPRLVHDDVKPLSGDTPEAGYQSLRQTLFLNMQAPFRVHQAWGYEVFPDARFTEARRSLSIDDPFGPLLDFVGARYILSVRPLPSPAVFKARRPNALLYENPGALPRVTWVPAARTVADADARLRFMTEGWDPRREVVVEEDAPAAATGGLETMRWEDARPGRMRAEGRSGGGWLVWSQTDAPGWEAWVNGKRARLWRANHAFQAAALPEGEWRAVFLYRPRAFQAGLGMAAAAAVLLTAAALSFLRRRETA